MKWVDFCRQKCRYWRLNLGAKILLRIANKTRRFHSRVMANLKCRRSQRVSQKLRLLWVISDVVFLFFWEMEGKGSENWGAGEWSEQISSLVIRRQVVRLSHGQRRLCSPDYTSYRKATLAGLFLPCAYIETVTRMPVLLITDVVAGFFHDAKSIPCLCLELG